MTESRERAGQAGRAQIVYCYLGGSLPLDALNADAKTDRGDLTPVERRAASGLAAVIKATTKAAE